MAHVNPIQIQKFLKGVDYPARKDALIEKARSLGADERVFESLEQLPDEEFETPADVSKAFGALPDDGGEGAGRAAQAEGGRKAEAGKEGGREAGKGRGKEDAKEASQEGGQQAAEPAREGARSSAEAGVETGTKEFLAHVLQDSMAEIQMSELALQRSENDAVKKFAQEMIDEHGVLGREIEKVAEKMKLKLPQELRQEHETAMKSLGRLHAEKFDRVYINHVLKDHDNDVKVFKHYADAGDADPEIRKLARKGEKMLTQHLKMAQDIAQQIKH
jgi:putative membrane protein